MRQTSGVILSLAIMALVGSVLAGLLAANTVAPSGAGITQVTVSIPLPSPSADASH
ncbi:MAG: hypothetical protein M0Z53_09100 [Thermaerobacter sp.]|nr:hypothetical protein [Thermaerobacter sp.]